MPESRKNPKNLNVRCPECRQHFEVDEALRNRVVECGGCDARFRVSEHMIKRATKIYPGERNEPMLDCFQRLPRAMANSPLGVQPVQYEEFKSPEKLEPTSPQRVLAGFVGILFIGLAALLLIFGSKSDSNGTIYLGSMLHKLVIAGSVSLLGSILLLYANPKNRGKAFFVALFLSAFLVAIPFFPANSPELVRAQKVPPEKIDNPALPAVAQGIEYLREKFTTKPLEKEQDRMAEAGNVKKAYGVYLKDVLERNKYTARDYLIRDTEADLSSTPYPRDEGSYLMVLTDVSKTFEEVAEIANKLGTLEAVHPEIGVVVVAVDNEQFLAGSDESLNDESSPAFYELNMKELQSIDIDRVERAVRRLADAPPTIFRKDITTLLTQLLTQPGVKFHAEIARALLTWTERPEESSLKAIEVIKRQIIEERMPPETLVELAVLSKSKEAIEPVFTIWKKTPNLWDKDLEELGPKIIPLLLPELTSEVAPRKRSAIRLLGKVGESKQIPILKELLNSKDSEVRLLAERAISNIQAR